ncbi:MAG: type I-U CRISPR-associated helicase/endonuclease Cas3 [Labilithrix sp.]|nr:type I-U CRISPR-associated helicase/endonuclease Cas3 [Labilithrix sp.]
MGTSDEEKNDGRRWSFGDGKPLGSSPSAGGLDLSTSPSADAMDRLRRALGLPDDATPFPWQQRLLAHLLRGELPRALDIPTGLGKTSVMAIWLVARSLGAPVPCRLVYVVDRRAVVDQATTVALELRELVDDMSVLKEGLGLSGSLPISTLRGQHLDNRQWLEDPSRPAIVIGTVDMIGSRLLFEGYGVSWKMRPYHAGFLGADSLLVLDEAHLVPPFERLLEAIASAAERGLGPAPDVRAWIPPLRLLSLSATGQSGNTALSLTEADGLHPVVKQRIHADKALDVRPAVPKGELAVRLAEEAHLLAHAAATPTRIVIFCDTRDDATKVERHLRKLFGKAQPELELFVGGRRAHERELLAGWLESRGFLAGGGPPAKTALLVATSAAEVGVDLDTDAAVADVVAWERMVQRLGRVNRRGDTAARVVLVPVAGDERSPDLRRASLRLLEKLPPAESGVQGSPAALLELRERAKHDQEVRDLIERATTPAPLHPPLQRPHVEAWSMTSLDVHTGRSEVDPWLRGWVEGEEPKTTLVFREQLPIVGGKAPFDEKVLSSFLEAAGPHASEELETEVWRALEWLDKRIERAASDQDGPERVWALAIERAKRPKSTPITAAILADKRRRADLERVLSRAALLVEARLGGLTSGLLDGDASVPSEEGPSLDLTVPDREAERRAVPFRVRRIKAIDASIPRDFEPDKSFPVEHDEEGAPTTWLRIERHAGQQAASETGRSVARREQALAEHQSWVEKELSEIADRLRLDPELARALKIAGRLHDEGKRAERWQRAFHVPSGRRPLAKSKRAPNVALLGGYRHELGSLLFVERDAELAQLSEELRDLVLHLVAAHHGRARPILPADGAEEAPSVLRARVREVASRFDRLSRRFGPWGLAWLESLLRAGDQSASKRNDEGGHDG